MLYKRYFFVVLAFLLLIITSCRNENDTVSQWDVPDQLVGTWSSDEVDIRVRRQVIPMVYYTFRKGSGQIEFTISSDNKVHGSIGNAPFRNGTLVKNSGDPKVTGVAFIVECGTIGQIFEGDHVSAKQVELWLGPGSDSLQAGLRLTSGIQQFPMAGMVLKKVK